MRQNNDMATQALPRITEEEYLALESSAEYKSEFVDGRILAMAGGSLRHSRIQANWNAELSLLLEQRGCDVFTSDAKVRTSKTGSYVYPDVAVVCAGASFPKHPGVLVNPVAIVEVLSPSTANYDRSEKFALYREIPSVEEYIMTHTSRPWVEHVSRNSDSTWVYREYQGMDDSIVIPSLNCKVAMARIYRNAMNWPDTPA